MDGPHLTYPFITGWHLDVSLSGAMFRNAAINIREPVSVQASVFISLGLYTWEWNDWVTWFLRVTLQGFAKLFSKAIVSHIPTSHAHRVPMPHLLADTCYCPSLHLSHFILIRLWVSQRKIFLLSFHRWKVQYADEMRCLVCVWMGGVCEGAGIFRRISHLKVLSGFLNERLRAMVETLFPTPTF